MTAILTSDPPSAMLTSAATPSVTRPALRRYRLADLAHLPRENGFRYEIFAGDLIMTPAPIDSTVLWLAA